MFLDPAIFTFSTSNKKYKNIKQNTEINQTIYLICGKPIRRASPWLWNMFTLFSDQSSSLRDLVSYINISVYTWHHLLSEVSFSVRMSVLYSASLLHDNVKRIAQFTLLIDVFLILMWNDEQGFFLLRFRFKMATDHMTWKLSNGRIPTQSSWF